MKPIDEKGTGKKTNEKPKSEETKSKKTNEEEEIESEEISEDIEQTPAEIFRKEYPKEKYMVVSRIGRNGKNYEPGEPFPTKSSRDSETIEKDPKVKNMKEAEKQHQIALNKFRKDGIIKKVR